MAGYMGIGGWIWTSFLLLFGAIVPTSLRIPSCRMCFRHQFLDVPLYPPQGVVHRHSFRRLPVPDVARDVVGQLPGYLVLAQVLEWEPLARDHLKNGGMFSLNGRPFFNFTFLATSLLFWTPAYGGFPSAKICEWDKNFKYLSVPNAYLPAQDAERPDVCFVGANPLAHLNFNFLKLPFYPKN